MSSVMLSRPLTLAEKKILEAKTKPSADDIQNATSDLFQGLLVDMNHVDQILYEVLAEIASLKAAQGE